MKKLLLSLALLSSLAIADNQYNSDDQPTDDISINNLDAMIANDLLPNGNYAGTFSTYSHRNVNGYGTSINNNMDIDLDSLPDLCGYTGKLKINVTLDGKDCHKSSVTLHLNQGACKFHQDYPIEFTECSWSNNELGGSYRLTNLKILTGTFHFIKQ
jgi:hypothetical protein